MLQVWIQNLYINEHMQGKVHSVYLILTSCVFHSVLFLLCPPALRVCINARCCNLSTSLNI